MKIAKLGLAVLFAASTIAGNVVAAESLQSSKDAVTQAVIAEPVHHKHVAAQFNGLKYNSKYNLVNSGGGSASGMTVKTMQCSKRGTMTASDCARHCR